MSALPSGMQQQINMQTVCSWLQTAPCPKWKAKLKSANCTDLQLVPTDCRLTNSTGHKQHWRHSTHHLSDTATGCHRKSRTRL